MAPADEARQHMADAEKALKPSWTSLKFSPDQLSASMEYTSAATKFRTAGLLQEAVEAWVLAAQTKEKVADLFGAGRAYESAGGICDGKGPGGSQAAVGHWTKAIHCFRLSAKNEIAAKLLLKIAEIKEKEGDGNGARTAFDEAIEVFQDEEKDYSLGDIYKQYTGFLVRSGMFEDAVKVMDGHVELLLRQKQPSFAHKEILGKVVIHLHLGDTVRAEDALTPQNIDNGWFASKECQAGSELVAAFQAYEAAEVERLLKEQVFTFLQVEIARMAKKLRIGTAPKPAPAPTAPAPSAPQSAVGAVAAAEPAAGDAGLGDAAGLAQPEPAAGNAGLGDTADPAQPDKDDIAAMLM